MSPEVKICFFNPIHRSLFKNLILVWLVTWPCGHHRVHYEAPDLQTERMLFQAGAKAQLAQLWHVNKPRDQQRDGCKMSLCGPEKNKTFMVVERDVGYQRVSHCGH